MPASMTLLQMEPDVTLHFCKTPTNTSPSRMLKLTNGSTGNVAFKVKTTAPKSYLVRPSSGTLRPRESTEVQIILQPPGDGRVDHRFLVQAVQVASSVAVSREQWAEFSKESIQEQRLSVVLEERESETAGGKANESYGSSAAAEAVGRAAGGSSMEAPADLQVKYDELVQYTLMLEKQKKKLEADIDNLQMAKGSSSADSGGYKTIHVILVALIAFILSYAAKFMG
ncbi:unnamed protein product [Polarella glacialis]|uniref:MSP domain-containing protein n=2 Tax=Polarella glacialis TaxID=89957 RepID=A0A813KPN1_POLGL|nr:unnamed protein product [Polarella glacialis]